MKVNLLTLLLCCGSLSVFCQNRDIKDRDNFILQTLTAAAQSPAQHRSVKNIPGPVKGVPAQLFSKPYSLKQILHQQPAKIFSVHQPNKAKVVNQITSLCVDSSFSRLLGVTNSFLYIQSVTQTSDGGMLVPAIMYDTTQTTNPWSKIFGLLIKLNEDGDVIWLKQFEELSSDFNLTRAFELPNHDIICTGLLSTSSSSSTYKTMVYRLNSSGNIIWKNTLQSTISVFNAPSGFFTYYVESAVEGINGDVILCGTTNTNLASSGKFETVVRLNNLGHVIWDANYGNHGPDGSYRFGAEGVSVFVENGQIILVGLSHGSNNPQTAPAVNFLTLNYSNGNVLTKRFFKPSYTDEWEEFEKSFSYWANKCIRLSNGHFLFYGKLFSDFINMTPVKDHFGVIEFDASFNLVNSYTISSGLTTNYYNNVLQMDPSGKGLISVFEYIDNYEGNVFFGAFNNKQFLNQRKAHYINAGMPGNNGFAFLADNGYAYLQTYYQNQPVGKSYFEFRKMHNSDTSSECLGKDTMVLNFLPLNIIEDPTYFFLENNEPNKIEAHIHNISQTDTLTTNSLNPCKQTNFCDTVKIHGNPVICGSVSSIVFTAFKNNECGGIVQWSIDNNVIDSFHVLSDSSVQFWFKNINWQGKLYANLPAGVCNVAVKDSIAISLVRAQIRVNLGPDTLLCSQNIMTLHAGHTFSTYLWQDGSTDSTLTVFSPGIYWVKASDLCGNNFIDSITINPFSLSINIGPDRVKCNNDTLRLHGPDGFLNYQWSNNYNISTTSTQNVIVNPLTDTAYYLRAEKFPGCFAYDTVKVKVNNSPPVLLGTDKSFCTGDSAVLNAGTGFINYLWNNGSTGQQLTVKTEGIYTVIATASNGCKSSDTLRIINVWPNPAVSLDHNTELCAGTFRTLRAGNFSTYVWQDGSTSPTFTINAPGTYYVNVSDNNNCKGSDTTHITNILPLPANFLAADTAICNYGNIVLKPLKNYPVYLWNTNTPTSSLTITSPGMYWLQVTDVHNCTGRDSVIVNPKECLKGLFVPTAFTPNNDGLNDNLKPFIGGRVLDYQFTIYGRWGQVVFTTKNINKGWDGTVAGVKQDTNIFVWVCSYQLEGEQKRSKKGTVLLIR